MFSDLTADHHGKHLYLWALFSAGLKKVETSSHNLSLYMTSEAKQKCIRSVQGASEKI